MQKLDQKQKMQVVVLGLLAVGMFGTFIFRMLQVSPAAAHTQTASAAGQPTTSTTGKSTLASAKATDIVSTDAPAPTDVMRDPFVPGIADEAAVEAYHKSLGTASSTPKVTNGSWNRPAPTEVVPLPSPENGLTLPSARNAEYTAAPLPSPASVAAPVVAAPSWTVTGVVQGDDGKMAILRNGDARRMVRIGDMVDDTYRVVEVGQGRVRLAHGKDTFTLPLGGVKTAAPAATSASTSGMPQANTPQDLGAPSEPVTGLPPGTVTPGGSTIDPNAVIKLPGGLTLPTVHLPAN